MKKITPRVLETDNIAGISPPGSTLLIVSFSRQTVNDRPSSDAPQPQT